MIRHPAQWLSRSSSSNGPGPISKFDKDQITIQPNKNMKTGNQIKLTSSVASWRGLAVAVCTAVCVVGITLAQHAGKGHVKVAQLSQREIIEKLDGKPASATVVEVTFEPGQEDLSHRHAGPVFGYVLEGEYEHAINDEPVKTYKAGETFYEPSGCVHRVARNPSDKSRTRLLAVILHSRDAKEVTLPHKGKE
jgi:quercetin dioxygenase-like cupin family protein